MPEDQANRRGNPQSESRRKLTFDRERAGFWQGKDVQRDDNEEQQSRPDPDQIGLRQGHGKDAQHSAEASKFEEPWGRAHGGDYWRGASTLRMTDSRT